MKTEIEQRQYNRFIMLYELYNATKGATNDNRDIQEIAANRGIKNGIFKEAYQYLLDEKYIASAGMGHVVNITHSGKKIVELIVTNPDEKTQNFASYKSMDF